MISGTFIQFLVHSISLILSSDIYSRLKYVRFFCRTLYLNTNFGETVMDLQKATFLMLFFFKS